MSGSADVKSIDVLREFKAAMVQFESDARGGLTMLQLELRRVVEWIEHDRPQYWPNQVRKAFDLVAEARVNLERCELRSPDGTRSSCYNEKKALDKAKRRLRLAQEKIEVVRRWRNVLRKESEEFKAQLAKMDFYLESDWAKALAAIDRMATALDRYSEARSAPTEATTESQRAVEDSLSDSASPSSESASGTASESPSDS